MLSIVKYEIVIIVIIVIISLGFRVKPIERSEQGERSEHHK